MAIEAVSETPARPTERAKKPKPDTTPPAVPEVAVSARQPRYRLTIDVRAELEGQLADCLHFVRRATGRTATRVEVIELLLTSLPTEPGTDLDDLIARLDEFRRTSPRR